MKFDEDQFTEEQCLSALAQPGVGSVAVSSSARTVAHPVRYHLQDGQLLMGTTVALIDEGFKGAIAGLLADGVDEDGGMRWIAMSVGPLESADPSTGRTVLEGQYGFRLRPQILSGRWLD
jgi:hypothetical protein